MDITMPVAVQMSQAQLFAAGDDKVRKGTFHMTKLSVGLEEAQEMTGISLHTFRKLVRKRKINAARVGRRILIPISELKKLVRPGANLASTSS
jgi:excisionase family DNA binding protein